MEDNDATQLIAERAKWLFVEQPGPAEHSTEALVAEIERVLNAWSSDPDARWQEALSWWDTATPWQRHEVAYRTVALLLSDGIKSHVACEIRNATDLEDAFMWLAEHYGEGTCEKATLGAKAASCIWRNQVTEAARMRQATVLFEQRRKPKQKRAAKRKPPPPMSSDPGTTLPF